MRHIDILLTKDMSYEVLRNHVEVRVLEGCDIQILSAKHLLKVKELIDPPRDKDILDISTLRKIVEQADD